MYQHHSHSHIGDLEGWEVNQAILTITKMQLDILGEEVIGTICQKQIVSNILWKHPLI